MENVRDLDPLYMTVRDTFDYDPVSGILTRKSSKARWVKPGSVAGSRTVRKSGKTYILVKMGPKTYLAHRLIYLYMTGRFPVGEVDHADGNGTNNAWSNLSVGTRRDNCLNVRRRRDNSSGHTGISFCKGKQKWHAYISTENGRVHLGFFIELDDAVRVRQEAVERYNYKAGHGSDRPI